MTRYHSMYERLVANSEKPDDQNENGCWNWTGTTDGKRWPYGKVNVRVNGKHKTVKAHREMEQQFHEKPLHPDEQTVEHLCCNRLCINPDHFILLTRAENSSASQAVNPRGFQDGR